MSHRWFCLLLVLVATVVLSCGDDGDDTVVSPSQPFILGDLINFDTSVPILVSLYDPSRWTQPERFVGQEQHRGEPFIDADGDGSYTHGLDIFIVTVGGGYLDTVYYNCDSVVDSECINPIRLQDTSAGYDFAFEYLFENHDINHNGSYDSPDDFWTPGLPYEDLNGNGLFDMRAFTSYQPGLPFADCNGNGEYDWEPPHLYSVEQWRIESLDQHNQYFNIDINQRPGVTHRWVSDSGFTYTIENTTNNSIVYDFDFVLDSAGFWFTGFGSQIPILIFEGPEIYPHPEREVAVGDGLTELRSIIYGESLTIHGRVHSGLVCVDIPRVYHNATPEQPLDAGARFYFAPNRLHLMAVRLYPPSHDSVWVYLDHRPDSLPLPLIR